MARVCQITGRRTRVGRKVSRRGKAKRDGGVGKKTTGLTKRKFKINLHWKKIWVPELGRAVRIRLSTAALRTVEKNGAYKTLLAAGLIKPLRKKNRGAGASPPVAEGSAPAATTVENPAEGPVDPTAGPSA